MRRGPTAPARSSFGEARSDLPPTRVREEPALRSEAIFPPTRVREDPALRSEAISPQTRVREDPALRSEAISLEPCRLTFGHAHPTARIKDRFGHRLRR